MTRNLQTKSLQYKRNYPPLFSSECLSQPMEDAFHLINEELVKESGFSAFLASVLFKNKDTDKIKKHVKEVAKGFSDEKFKSLTRMQSNLNYRRLNDDIKPILKVSNILNVHAKVCIIDLKKMKLELPEGICANYLVGIHDTRRNITRILRFYNAKTTELKMLCDLKKDGLKFIE